MEMEMEMDDGDGDRDGDGDGERERGCRAFHQGGGGVDCKYHFAAFNQALQSVQHNLSPYRYCRCNVTLPPSLPGERGLDPPTVSGQPFVPPSHDRIPPNAHDASVNRGKRPSNRRGAACNE